MRAHDANSNPKLALGTVQFGMPYGIMNSSATAVSSSEVPKILALAWRRGINMLDTAISYGNSDSVIASARPAGASFAYVTKMRALGEGGEASLGACFNEIRRSRALLGVSAFYAVLLHRADDLLGPKGGAVARALSDLRGSDICERIGVSVYDPETLAAVVDLMPVDVVQLPLNVLDQRFLRSGAIERLKDRGIEVHVRSVFLQGVLLAEPGTVPPALTHPRLAAYHEARRCAGISAAACALRFILSCPGIDRIVIGVDGVAHLRANLDAYDEACRWEGQFDYERYIIDDLDIIDPRRWPARAELPQ